MRALFEHPAMVVAFPAVAWVVVSIALGRVVGRG